MDNRAIGIFDSGLGGLTAVKRLHELLPGENIIYFGDSARMPYGGRPAAELRQIAVQDAALVNRYGIKAFLVACGTMSALAMDALRAAFPQPFFSVEDAACEAVVHTTRSGSVGVIATAGSIRSEMFANGIRRRNPALRVTAKACPGWAETVEQGHFRRGDALAEEVVARDLASVRDAGVDTLLLGCTHYPLLQDVIADYMGPEVALISCGAETAAALAAFLRQNDQLREGDAPGVCRYYTSGDPAVFSAAAEIFMGEAVNAEQASAV